MEVKDDHIVEQYVQNMTDFSASFGSKMSALLVPRNVNGQPQGVIKIPLLFGLLHMGSRSCCPRWREEALSPPEEFVPQKAKTPICDFVEVSFEKAVYPKEVLVYETGRPGALVRIWALGPTSWVLLWEGEPITADDVMSYVSPPIKQVDFPTQILRLEFNVQVKSRYSYVNGVTLKGKKPTGSENIERTPSVSSLCIKSQPSIEQGLQALNIDGKCKESSTSESVDVNVDEDPSLAGFHSLPEEMVLKVFKYFDMPTLGRCAQVNKQFYRAASDATLHKRMNFRPYWHSLRSEALLALAARCRLLQKLDLSWCGSHSMIAPEAVVTFLEGTGGNLTHLRMNNCKFVNNSVLEAIVRYAPNLKELSLRSVTSCTNMLALKTLNKLETLDLYSTNIDMGAAKAIIMANSRLQHINLGCCNNKESMDEVAQAIVSNCKHIVSVDLIRTRLSQVGFKTLKTCKTLKKLAMDLCYMSLQPDDSSKDDSSKLVVRHRLYL